MRLGITGASGKMGQVLIAAISILPEFKLQAIFLRSANKLSNEMHFQDLIITDSTEILCENVDVIIDFSCPSMTLQLAKSAAKHAKPLISGTTGLSSQELSRLKEQANFIPIVYASNMSIGINLVQILLDKLAKTLDTSFDIEIIEKHHRNKIDSPSGTALMLAKAITDSKNINFYENIIYSREGCTGQRPEGKIGISSVRGGSIIGEHDIMFISDAEIIKVSHQALNRNIFVNGALKACQWIIKQPPGLYSMQDVLATT